MINLSEHLVNINTSKSIKGVGTFTITLDGRKNWLNQVYPNDVINIYFDPGDGKRGFIRTMFGYVDRIDRSSSTTDNDRGTITTYYTIKGSDFSKAIEKTEIYFNPHIANRADFAYRSTVGAANLGGSALRTRGITAHGTPAQMLQNLLSLLLGFGDQWILPSSYPSEGVDEIRKKRLQDSINRASVGASLLEKFGYTVDDIESLGVAGIEADLNKRADSIKEESSELDEDDLLKKKVNEKAMSALRQAANNIAGSADLRGIESLQMLLDSADLNILDLMSLDFIETASIDGFNSSAAVWQATGSLMSMIKNMSNEIINELCFDLRPVAVGDSKTFGYLESFDRTLVTGQIEYSRNEDELGINKYGLKDSSGFNATIEEVEYRPAVIFREYPYSVVEGVDMSEYHILGKEDNKLGNVLFGPVFTQGLNQTGRFIYNYQNAAKDGVAVAENITSISPVSCNLDTGSKPLKHIDVVTISTSDTTSSNIGRSDKDLFNYRESYLYR